MIETTLERIAKALEENNALLKQAITARQELVNVAPATATTTAPAPAKPKAEKTAKPKAEPVVLPDPEPEVEETPEEEAPEAEDDGLGDAETPEFPAVTRKEIVDAHRRNMELLGDPAKKAFFAALDAVGAVRDGKRSLDFADEARYGELFALYQKGLA